MEKLRKETWPTWAAAAAAAKSLQSCLTLCDPRDGSPPGSPVPGVLQARTLEWVAISFSNTWKWKVKVKLLSRVRLLTTPWTAAYQAPLSMGFSRQEYWSGVPLPSPNMGYDWHLNIHLKQAGVLLSSASFAHTNESHLTVQLIQVQVLHQRAGKLLHQVLPIPTHCDNRRKQ